MIEYSEPALLFLSYAHEDELVCKELEKHLVPLQRQGLISTWHDRRIEPGTDWAEEIDEQLNKATVILLLISPDFMASDYCYGVEMQRALERHKAGTACVIPIILRHAGWQETPLGTLQALPPEGKPITSWDDPDEARELVARGIRRVIRALRLLVLTVSPSFDRPFIERLSTDLKMNGILPYQMELRQDAPVSQEGTMRGAMQRVSTLLLIASPDVYDSRFVKEQLELAAIYQLTIIVLWRPGEDQNAPLPERWRGSVCIDTRSERYDLAFQEILFHIKHHLSILPLDSGARKDHQPRNPYKGLRAFGSEDVGDFFGRETLIEECIDALKQVVSTEGQGQLQERLLAVTGPSGSGKSSVVMAGLLPRLRTGGLPGSETWVYLGAIVPGTDPIEALTIGLSDFFPEKGLETIRADLEKDSARALHQYAAVLARRQELTRTLVVLVVDQFEELFTQTVNEKVRRHFLDLLITAMTSHGGSLMLILTQRADFDDRVMQYADLYRLIDTHHRAVLPMEISDLRRVIEQPAMLPDVQLHFEENLVSDLLLEVRDQVGALPLLQFTLDQLFQKRDGHMLTRVAYQEMGGVKGALAQHAESTYQSLRTEAHQQLARALFLRLINPGTVEEDATKRRILLSELVVIDQEETARLKEVTNAFTEARLLTTNTVRGMPTVEVSHEALIRAWTRLGDWLHDARDDIRLQQAISVDAAEWNRHGQPADRLYRGSQLTEALRWREANLPSLDEDRFLQASIEERQRSVRRKVLMALAGIGGMAGTGLLVYISASGSPPTSSLTPTKLSLPPKNPPYAYMGHTDRVNGVAWSPDGQRIASGSDDTTVQVWNPSNGGLLLTYKGHTYYQVTSVAWSPDSKRIASGSWDTTVQVWDANSGSLLFTYKGHTDPTDSIPIHSVHCVAWSPDGKRIASGSADKTVQVWNASSGSRLLTYTGHTDKVTSVAWSPDSKRIASGSWDKKVQVWDASTGSLLLTHKGHTEFVESVAWSIDGKWIASGDRFAVEVWDASSDSHFLAGAGPGSPVAWSPDGKRLASSSWDNTVQARDASTGSLLFIGTRHSDEVTSVAWSPDSKHIASSSWDKSVWVWDASSNSSLFTYRGHTDRVQSVAWSPDGKRIASGSGDTTVHVWDADNGSHSLIHMGNSFPVTGVAWSPDGKRIASRFGDNTVQVWDASSENLLFTYTGSSPVTSVAWSPDGKRIASGSLDTAVQVWDANDGSLLLAYKGLSSFITSVAWSPDGKYIAASGLFNTSVQVFDASSGSFLLTYGGYTDQINSKPANSVAWSPDGKRIVFGLDDNSVQVWEVKSGNHLLTYTGHTDKVASVAWEAAGKRIASGSWDTTVQVWDANSGSNLLTYKGHTNHVECIAWSPDGQRIASGSFDNTVQVWDTLAD